MPRQPPVCWLSHPQQVLHSPVSNYVLLDTSNGVVPQIIYLAVIKTQLDLHCLMWSKVLHRGDIITLGWV